MRNSKTIILVEGAIMIALATILSYVRVYKLPWGGSITLLSMLPIVLFSIKNGVKRGLEVSFLFSLIQLGQGVVDGLFGWGLTTVTLTGCIFFDYIFAFTVIGLAGLFGKKGDIGWIAGTVIALLLRFACHFTTGVIIWKSYGELWGGFSTDNTYLYSLLYNSSYMLPEIIFTTVGAFVILRIPVIRKMIMKDR
jgi:thiamine transporter